MDAGKPTPGDLSAAVTGYSAAPGALKTIGSRAYALEVEHMTPARWDSGDDGLVTFAVGNERRSCMGLGNGMHRTPYTHVADASRGQRGRCRAAPAPCGRW